MGGDAVGRLIDGRRDGQPGFLHDAGGIYPVKLDPDIFPGMFFPCIVSGDLEREKHESLAAVDLEIMFRPVFVVRGEPSGS